VDEVGIKSTACPTSSRERKGGTNKNKKISKGEEINLPSRWHLTGARATAYSADAS